MALLEEPQTVRGHVADATGNMVAKTAVYNALVDGATGAMTGFGPSVFGLVGVSIASVASILMNQTHYQSRRAALRDMYKDEAAAQLGKSPDKIKDKDIEIIARGASERGIAGNRIIAEELDTLKKRRNVGMLVTVASILATVAVISVALPAAGIAGSAGGVAAFGALGVAGRMFLGFATHKILENPLKVAGRKMFNLEAPTTHERIADLNKQHRSGRTITREQVLSVFVSANKELSKFIVDNYGSHYDRLSVQEKHAAVEAMEQHIPITGLAKNLNSGSVKISELAFAVEGKISGVEPNSVKQSLNLAGKARSALRGVGTRLHFVKQAHDSVAAVADLQKNGFPKQPTANVEYKNPTPSRSFVERYQNEKTANISHTIH